MKDWLTIKEFSALTSLSPKALRLYDSLGLLTPQGRGENNYRYYSQRQIQLAREICKLKSVGFTLEEIKILSEAQPNFDIKHLLNTKLDEQKQSIIDTKVKIQQIEALLSSLNEETPLSKEQKEYIMIDLMKQSTRGLELKGYVVKDEIKRSLENEFTELQPNIKAIVVDLSQSLAGKDIYLGPGRGSSPASLLLYSLGITDLDPKKFNLLPEVFSNAKCIWIDVEYSNHQLLGSICDSLSEKYRFEVVGFRKPILDIYRSMFNKYGPLDFNSFSDNDPRIFDLHKSLDFRGIWDLDWSDQFHAFQQIPKDERFKYEVNTNLLKEILTTRGILNADDFMNISFLSYFAEESKLREYIQDDNRLLNTIPELASSNGLLLYREDWLRIFSRLSGVSISQAMMALKSLNSGVDDDLTKSFRDLPETKEKKLLAENAKTVFLKSHMTTCWYHFKRTSLLKYFWGQKYVDEINRWEDRNGIVYQDFGYKPTPDTFHLKA